MKYSQCNDYTALTVQWHKQIMQILQVLSIRLRIKTK